MARIAVPFTGITSQSNYNDGECRALVNLRPEPGGVQRPVPPRKVVQELSQEYDIVFVHRGNDYENWIGVINTDYGATVYSDIRNEIPNQIGIVNDEPINSVESIGNTLSFVTDTNIIYSLYKDENYLFLGILPELPAANIKTSDIMAGGPFRINELRGSAYVVGQGENFYEAMKSVVYKAMNQMQNGYKNFYGDWVDGFGMLLFDACFLRYAFRLYDGSLVKHSAPILIMPIKPVIGKEEEGNTESIKSIDYEWGGDGNITSDSVINIFGYRIAMSVDFTLEGQWHKWQDIIKSVDVFLSPQIGLSNIENMRRDLPVQFRGGPHKYNLVKSIDAEALKKVENTSNFFFIRSIPLGTDTGFGNYIFIPANKDQEMHQSDVSKMENLIYQEMMKDDPFSNHQYGAKKSYTFNNRLRLSNLRTILFNGFSPEMFMWFNTLETNPSTGEVLTNYNGYKYSDALGPQFGSLLIETGINTGTEVKRVYHSFSYYFPVYKVFMGAYLSYPDPRATYMHIYRYTEGKWYKIFTCNLQKHNLLNLAYYINDGFKPIMQNIEQEVSLPSDIYLPESLVEANKVKVSETNNPFLFPVNYTYQVGSGSILNESSLIMNVSDRNYGMYPVFVFTTDGIFTLSASDGDNLHASMQTPTYLEPPITDVVCATPYGVVFITKRGLMIINQHSTNFISQQLREDFDAIDLKSIVINEPSVNYPDKSFTDYLSGVDLMLYNPYRDELIIVNAGSDYNWVYDFPSKSFYISTERIGRVVHNTFPVYVMDGVKLKDFSQSDSQSANVAIITRPLLFRTPDVKKLERVMLRGVLHNLNNSGETDKAVVAVFHSNDGIHFECTRGMRITKNGSYKDIDMGMFARVKRRGYVFLFVGNMDEESQLQCLEIETDKDYNNEKMR